MHLSSHRSSSPLAGASAPTSPESSARAPIPVPGVHRDRAAPGRAPRCSLPLRLAALGLAAVCLGWAAAAGAGPQQTVLFKDINPGSGASGPAGFTEFAGMLFFRAYDGTNGMELWKSDGTAAGTVLFKDINPGSDSVPSGLTESGGELFFSANGGTSGHELWKSDGTAAGTVLVKDINPGSSDSYPSGLLESGGQLFFRAIDATHGFGVWKSDGTAAGTVLVKSINSPGGFDSPVSLARCTSPQPTRRTAMSSGGPTARRRHGGRNGPGERHQPGLLPQRS